MRASQSAQLCRNEHLPISIGTFETNATIPPNRGWVGCFRMNRNNLLFSLHIFHVLLLTPCSPAYGPKSFPAPTATELSADTAASSNSACPAAFAPYPAFSTSPSFPMSSPRYGLRSARVMFSHSAPNAMHSSSRARGTVVVMC